MINIKIQVSKHKVNTIIAKGHANYAEHGKDIVCSAVSAVLLGGFNNLNDEHEITLSSGEATFKKTHKLSYHDELVLETIIKQLTCIADNYPKYVQVKVEGE